MTATRFTTDHEYVRVDGDIGVVGVTDYAQSQLGDIVFIELPSVGGPAPAPPSVAPFRHRGDGRCRAGGADVNRLVVVRCPDLLDEDAYQTHVNTL